MTDQQITVRPNVQQVTATSNAQRVEARYGRSGPRGDAGPAGDRGPAGPPGTTDFLGLTNRPTIDARAYGVVADGTTDNTAALNVALAAAANAETDLVIPPGTYKLTGGITWDSSRHGVYGLGTVTLDFTGMTTGQAITVNGQAAKANTYGFRPVLHAMSRLRILGPTADATTVDGILFTDTSNGSHVTVDHVMVDGFRDQFTWGDQIWCSRFYSVMGNHAKRRILNVQAIVNSGENYGFFGCTFANATNNAGNATALYVDPLSAPDMNFYACSFDYDDLELDINSGTVTLTGCHIENHSLTLPLIRASYSSGNEHTNVCITGGMIVPTESGGGTSRPALVEIVSGDNCVVEIRGTKWMTYGNSADLTKVTAGAGSIRVEGGWIPFGGGQLTRPGRPQSVLYNGDFETGTLAGWTTTGTTGPTVAASTTGQKAGTACVKFSGTGTSGDKYFYQQVSCRPGQRAIFTAEMAADTLTAGEVLMILEWYAADGTTRVLESPGTSGAIGRVQTNTAYVRKGVSATCPPGAVTCRANFRASSINGNIYADDVRLALI